MVIIEQNALNSNSFVLQPTKAVNDRLLCSCNGFMCSNCMSVVKQTGALCVARLQSNTCLHESRCSFGGYRTS